MVICASRQMRKRLIVQGRVLARLYIHSQTDTLLSLRPYQEQCITTCFSDLYERNIRRQLVSLPVGSGKTVIFANLVSRYVAKQRGLKKALVGMSRSILLKDYQFLYNSADILYKILAHRKELIDQAEAQIKRFASHLNVGKDTVFRKINPQDYDVVVANVSALGRENSARLTQYNPADFGCIILDEAHHAPAPSWMRILNHFDALKSDSDMFIWGCTATARRSDGVALGAVFEHVTFVLSLTEMIQEKWLSDFRAECIESNLSLDEVKTSNGDFALGSLADAINVASRNDLIVTSYQQFAANRRSTLVFAVDLHHVETLKEHFCNQGIEARSVTGRTKLGIRYDVVSDFKAGKFPVLINCGVFTEGTDIPNIDCIIMARPTMSEGLYQQMIGRGLRRSPGKEDCLILDVVDQIKRCQLVGHPTLLGLEVEQAFNGELFSTVERKIATLDTDPLHTKTASVDDVTLMKTLFADYNSDDDTSSAIVNNIGDNINTTKGEVDGNVNLFNGPFAAFDSMHLWAGDKQSQVLMSKILESESISSAQLLCIGATALRASRFDWFFVKFEHIALLLPGTRMLQILHGPDGKLQAQIRTQIKLGDTAAVQNKVDILPITSDTMHHMLEACETYLKNHKDKSLHYFCLKKATWKQSLATDKQKKFLIKLGWAKGPTQETKIQSLTKGYASRLITQYREGGHKQIIRAQKIVKAHMREQVKEKPIAVGPLST